MFTLKRANGEVIAVSTEAIEADMAADCFRSSTSIWLDPRPSEGGVVAQSPDVPAEVTMRQARLALLAVGKLDAVATLINSLPEPQKTQAQIEWEYSNTVQRTNPFVLTLGSALGVDLDALFISAAEL